MIHIENVSGKNSLGTLKTWERPGNEARCIVWYTISRTVYNCTKVEHSHYTMVT